MSTYVFSTESENISGLTADRFKAAAGIGEGFGPHKGTGTIASAEEQRAQRQRGEAAFVTSVTESTSATPVRNGLVLAVVSTALRLNGVDATWTVRAKDGSLVEINPTDCIADLEQYGIGTLSVSLSTDLEPAAVVELDRKVRTTIGSSLRALDEDGATSAYAGAGKDFAKLLAASPVVAIAIGKRSALADLIETAADALALISMQPTTSHQFDASNLLVCPVCGTATSRTELRCSNGHPTAAAIRASQEIDFCNVVTACASIDTVAQALDLTVYGKAKGADRVVIDAATLDATAWMKFQSVSVSVTARADVNPWTALEATTALRTALDATVLARTGSSVSKARVINAAIEAIEKAANQAADEIAFPVATEIAEFIVRTELERRREAFAQIEADYRTQLVAKANPLSDDALAAFVQDTNRNRRFVGSKTSKTAQSPRRRSGRRRSGKPRRR